MKYLRYALLTTLVFLTSCSTDAIPFAMGELTGTEVAPPYDLAPFADADVIQFESNPAEPYSVNLWVIGMDDALFVHAGANRATWVEHIEENPAVRVGLAGQIIRLRAARVTDQETFDRLSEIYKEKYGNYPRNMDVGEAYLYKLTPP